MTNDLDWEAEMEALDASLPERLERAARMAERSDIWTDTERLMPATGVADLIWEAHSEILGWRALNKLRQDSKTCPLGEDCDLTVAWMAGRESAKDEHKALEKARAEEREAFQALLLEAATDLEAYIESDRPAHLRSQYPSYQAKWERDMELVNRIRARVAELKEDQ